MISGFVIMFLMGLLLSISGVNINHPAFWIAVIGAVAMGSIS